MSKENNTQLPFLLYYLENRFKMVRIGKPETMHLTVKDISLTELGKRDVKRMATNYSTKYFPTESFEEEVRSNLI